jgi:hypothetical protein
MLASAVLAAGLVGCGTDGVRYTVDGTATFVATAQPWGNIQLYVGGTWRQCGAIAPHCGESWQSGQGIVGAWSVTGAPNVYAFTAVVDVAEPDDGGDPPRSVEIYMHRDSSSDQSYGHVDSMEEGDTEDGWIQSHLVASFDCSGWR